MEPGGRGRLHQQLSTSQSLPGTRHPPTKRCSRSHCTLDRHPDTRSHDPFAATLLGETTPNLHNVEANHPNWSQILAEAQADPPPSSRLPLPS